MLQLVKERKMAVERVSEMANPVEALWEIELLYGETSFLRELVEIAEWKALYGLRWLFRVNNPTI